MTHFAPVVLVLAMLLLPACAGPRGTPASAAASKTAPKLASAPAPPFWFNRYWENWGPTDDSFHDFSAQIKPQAVQVGFFGPEYYSALNYARAKGEPMMWTSLGGGPVNQQWWKDFIAREHAQGVKVIGQISMALVFGDPDKDAGWFGYFDKDWDPKLLGPKPRAKGGKDLKATDLMQYDKPGVLYAAHDYKIEGGGEYYCCQSNPYYREVLKRFVKVGIDMGLDGYMVVFPIHENCVCEHCQAGFKQYLRDRYTPRQINEKFGIADLEHHTFEKIKGFYEPADAGPLALESLKFVEMQIWKCQRECIIEHGRKLKPDLLVGQWNHNYRSSMAGPGQIPGTFAQLNADERCVLPSELWAKDENWVWYSIGNWSLYWFPDKGEYSQFDLVHKWLRAAGHGLPQAVKRDDPVNLRVYFAEAVAHGGFAYARGPQYRDPNTLPVVKPYFDFAREHEDLYRDIRSYTDIALVFPRAAVHRGDKSFIPDFKHMAEQLTRAHVNYDVVIDEQFPPKLRGLYKTVLEPQSGALTEPATSPPLAAALTQGTVDATTEVVATAWRQLDKHRLLLHVVNYKKDAKPVPKGESGDRPLPQENIGIHLRLPKNAHVTKVRVLSPDEPGTEAKTLEFTQDGGVLKAKLDKMLVYSIVVVDLK